MNVEIFSPPQEKLAVRNMGESDHDLTEASLSASLSASGVEVMHEFGAAEDAYMLEEANEGFVTASEGLYISIEFRTQHYHHNTQFLLC